MNIFCLLIIAAVLQNALLSGLAHTYVPNWQDKYLEKLLVRDWACQKDLLEQGCPSDYLNDNFAFFLPHDQIFLILEIGSRDAIDGLCLSERFKAHVYSFECSPEALDICKYNIGDNPNITLVPLAVWNETKILSFFPIIAAGEDPLIGLSSVLPLNPDGPVSNTQKQRQIHVQSVRLDEWLEKEKIDHVDLMCIDVQGGSLQVLQGLGERLSDVDYIIAEVEYQPYYVGQVLYPEVEAHLRKFGFSPVAQMFHNGTYKDVADTLFIKNELITDRIKVKQLPVVGFYR